MSDLTNRDASLAPTLIVMSPSSARLVHPWVREASFSTTVTEAALGEIARTVGARPAETGAKLFGPVLPGAIDLIEFDEEGSGKSEDSVYRPDPVWGTARVQYWMSQTGPLQRIWVGDVHSHPGHFSAPSPEVGEGLGDLGYARRVLDLHPWLDHFHVWILTGAPDLPLRLWTWALQRGSGEPLYVPASVAAAVCASPRLFNEAWEVGSGQRAQAARSEDGGGSPIAEVHVDSGADEIEGEKFTDLRSEKSQEMTFHVPAMEQAAAEGSAVCPKMEGNQNEQEDEKYINIDSSRVQRREADLMSRYRSRLEGVVSPALARTHVVLVGIGGGSNLALDLARMGLGKLTLFDPDTVELENLCRTAFGVSDLGRPKVEALLDRIKDANPTCDVVAHASVFDPGLLASERVDLAVAGTDTLMGQDSVNTFCLSAGVPGVFIGVHEGALGGMVIWTLPGQTPCYRCLMGARYQAAQEGTAVVDLAHQHGSVLDITGIDTVAGKVAVAILERDADTSYGRLYKKMQGRTQVIVRGHPDYRWGEVDIFDLLLADLPKDPVDYKAELARELFFAMDSMWLRTSRDPECPSCAGPRCVNTEGEEVGP